MNTFSKLCQSKTFEYLLIVPLFGFMCAREDQVFAQKHNWLTDNGPLLFKMIDLNRSKGQINPNKSFFQMSPKQILKQFFIQKSRNVTFSFWVFRTCWHAFSVCNHLGCWSFDCVCFLLVSDLNGNSSLSARWLEWTHFMQILLAHALLVHLIDQSIAAHPPPPHTHTHTCSLAYN